MNFVLGVDGGASKTEVKAMSLDNNFSAENISGSTNYKSDGIDNAKKNLTSAIYEVIQKINENTNIVFDCFKSACFGLSGYDFEEEKHIYSDMIFKSELGKYFIQEKTMICNDAKIGLAAGSNSKNGVIFIAGTGSNCYGINNNGQEAKACGWDFILGDNGSGYEIGVKALRAIIRNYDGRGDDTLLSNTILEDLKLNNIFELVHWTYNEFSKEKIASIAKTVERTAYMGDKKSIELLTEEALEAVQSVKAVVSKLNIQDINFDCILAGSIFKDEKYFKSQINFRKLDCLIFIVNQSSI